MNIYYRHPTSSPWDCPVLPVSLFSSPSTSVFSSSSSSSVRSLSLFEVADVHVGFARRICGWIPRARGRQLPHAKVGPFVASDGRAQNSVHSQRCSQLDNCTICYQGHHLPYPLPLDRILKICIPTQLTAQSTPNTQYSYGWHRAEILAALVNGVFLLALCFTITLEALQRFFSTPGTTVEFLLTTPNRSPQQRFPTRVSS